MSLRYPKFESESAEAEWLYEHRDLIEAEFMIAGAEGRVLRQGRLGLKTEPAWHVAPDELNAATDLLRASGIWSEDHVGFELPNEGIDLLKRAS